MFISEDYDELWQAANNYVNKYFCSCAYAKMRSIASNDMHDKQTEAQEILNWTDGIWDDYYSRKDLMVDGVKVSYDFSNNGDCPHSVRKTLTA